MYHKSLLKCNINKKAGKKEGPAVKRGPLVDAKIYFAALSLAMISSNAPTG